MKIKICGLKFPENIAAVQELNPDMMGFIFYAPSSRYMAYTLDAEVLKLVPPHIHKVGVFVNETLENVMHRIEQYGLDMVQLHGAETPAFCSAIKESVPVLKAFGVDTSFDFNVLKPYQNHVDYFLFDTKTEQHGGSGKRFDWDVLQKYDLDVPFLLSGGIGTELLDELMSFNHPHYAGVDLNSKFEMKPGLKEVEKLKAFIELYRH
jgi:phosphoribosylanthranilate isomerase